MHNTPHKRKFLLEKQQSKYVLMDMGYGYGRWRQIHWN